jgi:hypothetical protein
MSIPQIDNNYNKHLTSQSVSDKGENKVASHFTEDEKNQIISILKTMEGFKRKLMLLLK